MVGNMVFDPHEIIERRERAHILLMRHPQTVANEQGRYVGAVNAPLSSSGEEQARRAIEGIIAYRPTAIVTSPLKRCLAIAVPAAERLGLTVEVDPRIGEMDFGVLEGLTYKEAVRRGLSFPWGETACDWPVDKAESTKQFAKRLTLAAAALEARSGRTAVIAHGGVIRGISSIWMQIPVEHLWYMTVRNIESAVFANDGEGGIFLERFGLQPEWLRDVP